ncbi:unnamed protein product [Effrenium voratum]|uniref:Uncharacterized protein n=1 Tax=Effrenium voratum TaxID=2562239 RepID=A0AA36N790_9DINO|nr:unnamed protein product [Effrenium voratum]CAJ1451681.1 unnamed protein product [Effrenium voratum]
MPVLSPAEQLASQLGCDVSLAQAALKVCHGGVPAAAQVIEQGRERPLEPYEGLLAQARVRRALEEQPGPPEEKWLICIRTFGRPGTRGLQSELHRLLFGALKMKQARILEEKLETSNLTLLALRRLAKTKSPEAFRHALKQRGVGRVTAKTAQVLAEKLCEPLEEVEKKLAPAEKGLPDLTLAALERALGPGAHKRCLIFVSHTDAAWSSGQYAAALKRPWADRVVVGVRGAHLQVRFIEEAAPAGSHIVIMDDNIEKLVVEVPDDAIVAKQKAAGIQDCYTLPLSWKDSMSPLWGTGLQAVQESEVLCFLRSLCPELARWKATRQVEAALRNAKVGSLKKFQALSPQRAQGLLRCLSAKKRKACHAAAKGLEGRISDVKLSAPRMLARPGERTSKTREPELCQLIRRAGREMTQQGVHLWGINPTRNHYFLKGRGDDMRQRALSQGIFQDFSNRLGLVYGAWFGIRVTHKPQLYTRQGQIKDDVERTLRYWHHDGKLLRFTRYSADKNSFRPGQFGCKKGGISSSSSPQAHGAEADAATRALVAEFGAYARLPRAGERSSCGLIWTPEVERSKPAVSDPKAKRVKRG